MNEETREIMLILQEEGAEVIQAVSKCMRFGPDQIKPGKEVTNIGMLEEEIGVFEVDEEKLARVAVVLAQMQVGRLDELVHALVQTGPVEVVDKQAGEVPAVRVEIGLVLFEVEELDALFELVRG